MPGAVAFPEISEDVPEVWSTRLSALGALLSLPALAYVLVPSIAAGSWPHILSFSAYGVGVLSMFTTSAYFHSQAGRERTFSKCLDYGAIGVMIAGSFTPYCALAAGPSSYGVLALEWALALCALVLRVARPRLSKWVFVSIFIAMGWLGLLIAPELWRALGPGGSALILLGGLIYTAGTLFFNRFQGDVEPPGFGSHDIWHLFIILAAASHYLVFPLYLLP